MKKKDIETAKPQKTIREKIKEKSVVEERFKFHAEERDNDFSSFHVEPLLDQAADLLDRALKLYTEFQDLTVKSYDYVIEFTEFEELDKIHQEEEANGFYDVERKQSEAEHISEQRRYDWLNAARIIHEKMFVKHFSESIISRLISAAKQSAFVVGQIPYFVKNQEFDRFNLFKLNELDFKSVTGVSSTNLDSDVFSEVDFDGNSDVKISWLATRAAEFQAFYSLNLSRANLAVEDSQINAMLRGSQERLPGLEARAKWDSLNSDFKRRRTTVARTFQQDKMHRFFDRNSPLNYDERSKASYKLFSQDFRDALARLQVVQKGLKEIYGYDLPLPAEPLPTDESEFDYFNKCLLWSRQAISWLIRFSRAEQSLVLPISLKSILSDTDWNSGLLTGTWKINISEENFSGLMHTRLRGLSAFIIGDEAKNKLWQLDIQVPTKAIIKHVSGNEVILDQSKISLCKLARVTDRNAQRDPDLFGLSALFNTSPIGKWKVQIIKSVPSSTDFLRVEDIHIDLHLVFRA
jgi:hypothetical protein